MVERKAVSTMVSYALIVGVVIMAIMIVLQIANPILGSSRDVAQIQQAQDVLTEFDSKIREVSSFGRGTSVTVSYSISRGRYEFVPENDTVYYHIETDADVISKNVSRSIGPVNMSRGNDDVVNLKISFNSSRIDLVGRRSGVGSGFYDASFSNNGSSNEGARVEVSLR